jgi:UDP-4-amino-4,6-dideoxy-N-acetyl-beta-L-altrosamine N-acetyltransferase
MLQCDRLILRAIEEDDLPLIAGWRNDPGVYEFFYEYIPISRRQQAIWYESQLKNPKEINLVVSTPEGKAIGTVSIYNIDFRNRKAEWGRILIGDADFRGCGFGSMIEAMVLQYAFEHLNLHKLYCEVLEDNTIALSLYKKFGFKEEGVLREHIFKNGTYVNVVVLSMLEEEYFKQKESGSMKLIDSNEKSGFNKSVNSM